MISYTFCCKPLLQSTSFDTIPSQTCIVSIYTQRSALGSKDAFTPLQPPSVYPINTNPSTPTCPSEKKKRRMTSKRAQTHQIDRSNALADPLSYPHHNAPPFPGC